MKSPISNLDDLALRYLEIVCTAFAVAPSDLIGPSRRIEHTWPRYLLYRALIDHAQMPILNVARRFSRRPSAIWAGLRALADRRATEPEFNAQCQLLDDSFVRNAAKLNLHLSHARLRAA